MYWLADQEFAHAVPLVWERTAKDPAAPGEVEAERMVIADAVWRQKGQAHYLTFTDPEAGKSTGGKIVLRILPDRLVLTRFGDVTWNHTFAKGVAGKSGLRMGGFGLDVETETRELDIRVDPEGGVVRMEYRMTMAGVVQDVRLQLRFGESAKAE